MSLKSTWWMHLLPHAAINKPTLCRWSGMKPSAWVWIALPALDKKYCSISLLVVKICTGYHWIAIRQEQLTALSDNLNNVQYGTLFLLYSSPNKWILNKFVINYNNPSFPSCFDCEPPRLIEFLCLDNIRRAFRSADRLSFPRENKP